MYSISLRYEFSLSYGVAPTTTADIDDIQRTTEQHALAGSISAACGKIAAPSTVHALS
ncbi:hypothetical protein [Nocardia sp. NPDC047654]|uniref:hypothetical protein n=1 Tax=Nocardia sp. NPDC047654 TaxID=3364314 RepID=UPI00371008B3